MIYIVGREFYLRTDFLTTDGIRNMEHTPEKHEKSDGGNRGKDTIFRVAARNQIELIAIADNKANMIIGICVVMISLVIALLGSGLLVEGAPIVERLDVLVPLGTLMVFALCSAIFAMLAAKPEIIKDKPAPIHSLLFFQNISEYTPEKYVEEMHKLFEDKKATYDQMIIDMYFNGVVLNRKYKLLNYAYILFMVGLITTVVAFGVATLMM